MDAVEDAQPSQRSSSLSAASHPSDLTSSSDALSPFPTGAFNTTTGPVSWELLLRSRATDNQLYVLGCSPARPSSSDIEAGSYPAWGHSSVVDPWAKVLATTEEGEGVVRATLEPEMLEKCRTGVPIGRQRELREKEAMRWSLIALLHPRRSLRSLSQRSYGSDAVIQTSAQSINETEET